MYECETTGHPLKWFDETRFKSMPKILLRCSICLKSYGELEAKEGMGPQGRIKNCRMLAGTPPAGLARKHK